MKENTRFLERLESFIIENKLIKKDDKILVGFSGGQDSTSLLHGLWCLRAKFNISLLAVHVNYMLRGNESQADEEFVKNFCFDRNISLVVEHYEIDNKSNLENHAREIRFGFFNKLIALYRIDKVALGHNKMDQAETILYRMIRGSGYTGLRGIMPRSNKIIHPMLNFSREEIINYLKSENLSWREDSTNKDTAHKRNMIRHELIPWFTDNMNPRIVDKLAHTSYIFSQTDEILRELSSKRLLKGQIKSKQDEVIISVPILQKTKAVLRFYIYKEIYSSLKGDEKDFYHGNFEEIDYILDSEGSKEVSLPHNIKVFKEYNQLIFTRNQERYKVDRDNAKEITALRNRLTFENYRIIMEKLKKLKSRRYLYEDKEIAYIDLDKLKFPLTIRHRRPGDKFIPVGMKHHKKLKDFFIDEKVSKFERDKVLLFSDQEKIFWIAGLRIDDRVKIGPETNNILKLRIEKIVKRKTRPAERIKKRK